MKLDRKQRQMIVLGIAVIIIIIGAAQAIFKLDWNKKIVDEVTFVMMLIAIVLLFGDRNVKKADNEQIPPAEEIKSIEADNDMAKNEEEKQ